MKKYFLFLCIFALIALGIYTIKQKEEPKKIKNQEEIKEIKKHQEQENSLYAVLWFQHAQECKALIASQYKLASLMLDKALEDKSWTAAPEEQKENFSEKPPAVILDIDETVLDNSPFQTFMIQKQVVYDEKLWKNWVLAEKAKALPGALEFIKYAQSKNVKVFYISNRDASCEQSTRQNLKAEGFTLEDDIDTVLLKNEKPDWRSKKGTRRAVVAANYRILLLLGDNLGDFVEDYQTPHEQRDQILEKNFSVWGEKWIVLPNPMYGSWESAMYNFDYNLSFSQKQKLMLEKLILWDEK